MTHQPTADVVIRLCWKYGGKEEFTTNSDIVRVQIHFVSWIIFIVRVKNEWSWRAGADTEAGPGGSGGHEE